MRCGKKNRILEFKKKKMKAKWNDKIIVESNDTVIVENNHYD